jgi:flagellar hook-basal body complex protein FliE
MSVEAVAGFLPSAAADKIESRLAGPAGGTASAPGFGAWLSREIGHVNQQIQNTDKQVQDLALGKTANLHDVMIALEETKLSFQLMMQIRTRALEAYQEILRMQV